MKTMGEKRRNRKSKKHEGLRGEARKHRNLSYSESGSGSSEDDYKSTKKSKDREPDLQRKKKSRNHGGERVRSHSKQKHSEKFKDAKKQRLSSPEQESSSESDSPEKTSETAKGVVLEIVEQFPEIAAELKQLLYVIDSGQVADISALPNEKLVFLLQKLFCVLKLHRIKKKLYALPKGGCPTLEILGPILTTYIQQNILEAIDRQSPLRRPSSVEQTTVLSVENKVLPTTKETDSKSKLYDQDDQEYKGIGPAPKPISTVDLAKFSALNPLTMNQKRFIGPTVPSQEQLAAVAKLSEAESLCREAEEALEQSPFIGPPPPDAVAEAESANEAERFEEVTRINALESGNPYELLRANPSSSIEGIKKRYWKLSLLVHPDKCAHPQAHQAFTAVNKAFKDLEDVTKRAEIDQKLDEKQRREEWEVELKSLKDAAHWRRLRGEPLEGDDDLLDVVKVATRDEWMTSLPPERQAGPPSMQSTFFSKSEKSGRGDTSAWTDTPSQIAEKAKMQYLEAYKQAALTSVEDSREIVERQSTSKVAELVDKYNEKKRPRSLLEEHKLKRTGKSEKTSEKCAKMPPKGTEADWSGKHPWKPWDREKDLMAGRKPVSLDAKLMGQGLSSRFSSKGSERKFL